MGHLRQPQKDQGGPSLERQGMNRCLSDIRGVGHGALQLQETEAMTHEHLDLALMDHGIWGQRQRAGDMGLWAWPRTLAACNEYIAGLRAVLGATTGSCRNWRRAVLLLEEEEAVPVTDCLAPS